MCLEFWPDSPSLNVYTRIVYVYMYGMFVMFISFRVYHCVSISICAVFSVSNVSVWLMLPHLFQLTCYSKNCCCCSKGFCSLYVRVPFHSLLVHAMCVLSSTNKLKHNHLNHCILKIRITRSHISGFPVCCCFRSRWWFSFSSRSRSRFVVAFFSLLLLFFLSSHCSYAQLIFFCMIQSCCEHYSAK